MNKNKFEEVNYATKLFVNALIANQNCEGRRNGKVRYSPRNSFPSLPNTSFTSRFEVNRGRVFHYI